MQKQPEEKLSVKVMSVDTMTKMANQKHHRYLDNQLALSVTVTSMLRFTVPTVGVH